MQDFLQSVLVTHDLDLTFYSMIILEVSFSSLHCASTIMFHVVLSKVVVVLLVIRRILSYGRLCRKIVSVMFARTMTKTRFKAKRSLLWRLRCGWWVGRM